jgi:hypothetical protein
MPMIMPGSQVCPHRAHRPGKTNEQRFADHVIADVEFDDLGQRGDGFGRGVIETVAGMDLEPGGSRKLCARDDALPFGFGLGLVAIDHGIAPGAGMNFDHRRAQFCSHFDLPRIGRDEQRYPYAGVVEPRNERRQRIVLPGDVETAFGRQFLAPLGHQTDRVRICLERNPQHILRRRHLEIQRL